MIFAILGSLGGVVAFLSAVVVVVRAIFKQVGATEDNTKALNELKDAVGKLDADVSANAMRIARIETQLAMRRGPR